VDRKRLEELRRLTAMLGARLRVEEGEDVADVAIRVAQSLGATYVLMGSPSPRRGLARLGESLLTRLLRGLPGVDVRIVTDPRLRRGVAAEDKAPAVEGVPGEDDERVRADGTRRG
jgi:two-component system sensor histidine kinase KdpD